MTINRSSVIPNGKERMEMEETKEEAITVRLVKERLVG